MSHPCCGACSDLEGRERPAPWGDGRAFTRRHSGDPRGTAKSLASGLRLPVELQIPSAESGLGFYAARSYSLTSPPSTGERAVDVEVVAREHGRGLGAPEPAPGAVVTARWRWRYAQMFEDLADRGGADAVSEAEQSALDALVSQPGFVPGHLFDQPRRVRVDRWAPGPVRIGPSGGRPGVDATA